MSFASIPAGRLPPARNFGLRQEAPLPARSLWRPAILIWEAVRQSARQMLQPPPMFRRSASPLPGVDRVAPSALPDLPEFFPPPNLSPLAPEPAYPSDTAARALRRMDARRTFGRLAIYVAALTGLALITDHLVRTTDPDLFATTPAASPQAEWINVANPFPVFSVSMPSLPDSVYTLRRHTAGGRQDIMRWGAMADSAPHLMIEIDRPAGERSRFESAMLEIAAKLENAGAPVATLKPAGDMDSKFGPVSLVAFSPNPSRHCLGFTRPFDEPRLQILGWYCESGPGPVTRETAACALDRLSLLSAGSGPKLRELFARAELKRNFCGQPNPLMAPTPRFMVR